jgi:hypothetical protein
MSERIPRAPVNAAPPSGEGVPEPVAPTKKEVERQKLRAVVIETTRLTEAQAHDVADHRMTESKEDRSKPWLQRTVSRVWKHNLFQEYYRQREIQKAREQIHKTGNLYAGEEGGADAKHKEAMKAVMDRFTSEHDQETLTEKERWSKHSVEGEEANRRLKSLIQEYAGDPTMTEEIFGEERTRILSTLNPQEQKGGTTYADNFLEIATEMRKSIAHGAKMQDLDFDVELTLGKARESLNTEAKRSTFDKVVEKMKGNPVGSLLANEASVLVAAGGYSLLKTLGLGAVRSNVAKLATFGAGAVLAGGIAGYNESVRLERERAQHTRERAKGMTFDEKGMKRREEMEESRHETRSAASITATLQSALEKTRTGTMALPELKNALVTLADLESRIALGDQRKTDLISYSRFDQVEQERTALLLTRARLKAALKKQFPDFDAVVDTLKEKRTTTITGGDEGLDAKDRIFKKMKGKKVAGAVVKTVLIGGAVGLVAQEVGAAFNPHEDGFFEGAWKSLSGHREDITKHATAIEGLRRLLPHTSPLMPSDHMHDQLIGSSHVDLPEGATLHANPDGTYDLLRDGEVFVPHVPLTFNHDGTLSDASKDFLSGHDIGSNTSIVGGGTESAAQYVHAHGGLTHHVHRTLWYDNDTPKPVFDKNELKEWWGGEHGTGIDEHGNYVFSMKHMLPKDSYHAATSVDAQERMHAHGLKMLFSLSRDTQHQVFEVSIDENGNAIIPKDSEIAKLMFTNAHGHATFTGRFAEIAQDRGAAPDGAENVRLLSTYEGPGRDSITNIPVPHVRLAVPDRTTIDWPPFLPIPLARIPLERGVYSPNKEAEPLKPITPVGLAYYMGAETSREQEEEYKKKISPTLRDNPNAQLDERAEASRYFNVMDSVYRRRVRELAEAAGPMDPECAVSVCIPVAGHQEEANIERTLSSYLNQTADPRSFELMLFLNHPDKDEAGNPVKLDRTAEHILRFKKDHPEMLIKIIYAALPRDEAKIGNIRKYLNDAALMRAQMRPDNKEIVMVSNDADIKGIAPEYIENFQKKFSSNEKVDAIMGQLDWDPEAYIRNPLVHIGTRLFQYIDMLNRKAGINIGSSGANFAFRGSSYAAVGGYSADAGLAEDVDLGRRMRFARKESTDGYIPIAFGGARVSRLYTSARRAEKAVRDGLAPVEQWQKGFGAFDDEVRKTKWEDTGSAPDYSNPEIVQKLTVELETVINRTLRAAKNWQDADRFAQNMDRSLGWLGVKFEKVGDDQIKITDASKLIAGLKEYQEQGMEIMARKTGQEVGTA